MEAASQPAVSVIVPARDAAATLPALFDALARQEGAPAFEVVVADDGSADATAALARSRGARVVATSPPGSGPSAARNAALAVASGRLLAFTDADCAPAPGWLAAGAAALDEADLVQGTVGPSPGVARGPFDRTIEVLEANGLFQSANLFARSELLERLGGFEPGVGLGTGKELGEDAWLGWRAVRAGARVRFCAQAHVYHHVFARSALAFAAERARLRFFPELVARIPELRRTLLWSNIFLSRRSAAFDLMAIAAAVALTTGRRWPLVGALPYAVLAWRMVRGAGRRRMALVLAAQGGADAIGAAALVAGSVRARSLLL